MERQEVIVSVCQGEYDRVDGRLVRIGTRVTIVRPDGRGGVYENPRLDSFVAVTDLARRHHLRVHPWGTMVGYSFHWTPGTRAEDEPYWAPEEKGEVGGEGL